MFKEIVSQISFSPAMVERLSTYARTTKRRQHISGWAFILATLLLVLQVVVTVAPPPQTGASSDPYITTQPADDFISSFPEGAPLASTDTSIFKDVNAFLDALPHIDNSATLILHSILVIGSAFIYMSLRQRSKEIRIIRTQLNTGGL